MSNDYDPSHWPLKVLQRKYKALAKRSLQLCEESMRAQNALLKCQRERNALADKVLRLEHNIVLSDSEDDADAVPTLRDELRPIRAIASFLNHIEIDATSNGTTNGNTNSSAANNSAFFNGFHDDANNATAVPANAASSAYYASHATSYSPATVGGASNANATNSNAGAASSNAVTSTGGNGGGDDNDDDDDAAETTTAVAKSASQSAKKRKRKSDGPHEPILCTYADGRPCKSRAQIGSKFCYHHQPMDPNSDYVACEFKGKKKCSLPVRKDTPQPRLCKRHLPVDPAVAAAAAAAAAAASTATTGAVDED